MTVLIPESEDLPFTYGCRQLRKMAGAESVSVFETEAVFHVQYRSDEWESSDKVLFLYQAV